METLQLLLARYLGLRVPRPGEGTAWRFDWHLPEPHWLLLLVGIITLIFVVGIYRRDGESLRWPSRLTLITLRIAVFACLLAMLTELSLTIERTGLPIVAVLIDTSASMSLNDQYSAKSNAGRLANEVLKSTQADPNRLSLVQQVFSRKNGQFIHELNRGHQLRFYRFAETANAFEAGELGETAAAEPGAARITVSAVLKEIAQLQPDGDQTRPGPSVNKVLGDLRGAPPAAIVVFSDGVASISESDKISTIAESARRKGVQLHLVGTGGESAAKDLYLYDTQVDEVAFVQDPMLFRAKIKSFGFNGKKVTIQLRKEDDRTVLAKQEINAPEDGQSASVEVSYSAPEAGEFDYVLEIAEQTDEMNRTNNSETRHVSVRDEKMRVLLVDGGPRWEFRFLKQLLERDKSIELSTLLQEADVEYSQEDRTAIVHFPVKKEDLARFDVLILGDISPVQLGMPVMETIRDYVRQTGGSVVFIAGSQNNPQAFQSTPLESLLPFEASQVKVPAEGTKENFHPTLTLEGQKGNSLFRLGNSEAESLSIWNSLPNLTWFVELPKLKPGARVFAEHPEKTGTNGRLPIIMIHQVGAGKVLYHATDESWRWRFLKGDLYHGRYWIQAIRYLSRGRLIGKDRTAELTVDQMVFQRGQPVTVRVKFIDEKFIPPETDGVSVTLERKGEGRQTAKLTRLRELPNVFEGQVTRLADGTYHGWISQPAFNEAPPSVDFRVETSQRELLRRDIDKADLQQAASVSHGQFYTFETVDRLPAEIPKGTPVAIETDDPIPLWNRWELFTLATMLLGWEWLLRKRHKLV